jgi:hypothetical protein
MMEAVRYPKHFEKAYLVTPDSDLMPAVKIVSAEFPEKEIVAVAPPIMGHSNGLMGVCNSKRKIHRIKSGGLPPEGHSVRPSEYD